MFRVPRTLVGLFLCTQFVTAGEAIDYHSPLLIAGKGGGTISGGQIIDRKGKTDQERYISNVHIACAQRMGCDITKFGNGHRPVDDLLRG